MFGSESPYQIAGIDVYRTVGLAHAVNGTGLHYRVGRTLFKVGREHFIPVSSCLSDGALHDDPLARRQCEIP